MYNLDVVIAVGYRVNSYEARIWARNVLKEYIVIRDIQSCYDLDMEEIFSMTA